MMELVIAFYERSNEALSHGASIRNILSLPVRESIGRYKYTTDDKIEEEYKKICEQLDKEEAEAIGKEDF